VTSGAERDPDPGTKAGDTRAERAGTVLFLIHGIAIVAILVAIRCM